MQLGLLEESTLDINYLVLIIGAMIVDPLMLPIRGLIGSMVGLPELQREVLARSEPTLLDLGIAIAAGGISGEAKVEPKISSSAGWYGNCCRAHATSLCNWLGSISSRLATQFRCNPPVPDQFTGNYPLVYASLFNHRLYLTTSRSQSPQVDKNFYKSTFYSLGWEQYGF